MTFRELLNKTRIYLPFASFSLSLYFINMAINNQIRNKKILEDIMETNRLLKNLNTKQDIIINKMEINNNITTITNETSIYLKNAEAKHKWIEYFIKKLNDPIISVEERGIANKILENYINTDFFKLANNSLNKIIDQLNKCENGNNLINETYELIQRYLEYFSTLSIEQMAMIVNFWAFVIFLNSIISIAAVFYGDFLIRYFKLEIKFPRFAKFIQIRRKFQFYYLNINMLIISIISIYLMWFNIKIYYLDIINLI